jgi:DNA-directed RNA polymerase specialized sigma24 family protein
MIDRPVVIATIRAALQTLPANWRDVLVRRYWHDEPYSKIASALGVSDGVARMMTSRAIARLRRVIAPIREALHAA